MEPSYTQVCLDVMLTENKLEISWRWFEGGFKTTVWLLGWCINKRGDVNLPPLSSSLLSKKRSRQYIICWDAYQKTYYFYVVQAQQHINKNISNWLNSERMVNTFSFILSVQCSAPNRDKKNIQKGSWLMSSGVTLSGLVACASIKLHALE